MHYEGSPFSPSSPAVLFLFVLLHIHPAPQHVEPRSTWWMRSGAILAALRARPCKILQASFREHFSVLKNSLGACFHPRSGTKYTGFGTFRAQFLVVISSMPTFSTGWLLPRRTVNKVMWMGRGLASPALKVRSTIEWLPSPTSGPPLALAWGEEAGERNVQGDRPHLRVLEGDGGGARG